MLSDTRSGRKLLYRYGISPECFSEIVNFQQGTCPFCLEPLGSDTCVDHNPKIKPKRKSVRGVLHRGCNTILGFIEARPWLASDHVRDYLQNPPAQQVLSAISDEDRREIRELVSSGTPLRQIADALGYPYVSLRQEMREVSG